MCFLFVFLFQIFSFFDHECFVFFPLFSFGNSIQYCLNDVSIGVAQI